MTFCHTIMVTEKIFFFSCVRGGGVGWGGSGPNYEDILKIRASAAARKVFEWFEV